MHRQLALRQLVLRVVGETGVVHGGDTGVVAQRARASASADADAWRWRTASVRRPRSPLRASNGDAQAPCSTE